MGEVLPCIREPGNCHVPNSVAYKKAKLLPHYQKSEVASKKVLKQSVRNPIDFKRYRFHKDLSQTTEY